MTTPKQVPIMMPLLGEEEQNAAAEAIASGWVAQGPRVAEFERCFADQLGVDHAVAVSSCTTALHLALVVAGVVPGDEVIVPSLSFIATANVVRHAGAEPVFADVDLTTQNLTPEIVEDAITPATRAVIVVDQAGMPADVTAIRAVCDPRGIVVVEELRRDCLFETLCQSFGSGPILCLSNKITCNREKHTGKHCSIKYGRNIKQINSVVNTTLQV